MTGATRATGQPVWRVRTCIEVTVATGGWLLGGTPAIGTILVALCMGPLLGVLLPRTVVRLTVPARPVRPGTNRRLR